MIPVIIGATIGLAGVAIFSGNDKSNQPVTEKHAVSEDYVRRQLNHAGKSFSPGGNSVADFAKLENSCRKKICGR